MGGGADTNATIAARGICNAAFNSPVVIAFTIEGDEDHVFIGHSLTVFPQDIARPTSHDNRVIALVGNDLASAVPMCFPAESWTRPNQFAAHNVATITGAAMCGAGPPAMLRSGPHAGGAADTDAIRVRRTMLLPPNHAQAILNGAPEGRYSLNGFYNTLLAPVTAAAVPAEVALWAPVVEWWRAASTDTNAGTTQTSADLILDPHPLNFARLLAWANRAEEGMLRNAGVGGPGLTTAAFNQGVANIQNTLQTNATNQLDFERNRANRTFTEKHGDSLAQRLCYLTGAVVHYAKSRPFVFVRKKIMIELGKLMKT